MSNIVLFDYQDQGVREVRKEFRAKNDPVVYVLPTGGGKTYTFSYIADSAMSLGKYVIIVVHRKELLLQASRSLDELGVEHGLISPHFTPDFTKHIQVASIDTLLIRLEKWKYPCDLLIFDEGHHVVEDNKWGALYEALNKPLTLLVTATPVRSDGKGLGIGHGGICKSMVIGPSPQELIERGKLVNPVVYASPEIVDLSGLRKNKKGEYTGKAVAERVDKPKITGSAVEHYNRICPGAKAIVFCASVEHAKHVRDAFNAAGYRFALLVGEPHMSDAERTAVNKALRRGDIDGACTVDLVSEGYDLPDLECCIMLRPTASEALFIQQAGRVMRASPNKRGCWLLDHVANVGLWCDGEFKRKHGFPNETREWSLEGRVRRKGKKEADEEETIDVKQCPKCYIVHPAAPQCPACGHIYPANTGRKLEHVDGELVQVTPEMLAKVQARKAQAGAQSVEEMVTKLGYKRERAEAIVAAREEKQALINSLVDDLTEWRDLTGQTALDTFGVPMAAIRNMKPKALKELRAKFEAHKTAYAEADPTFQSYLDNTLQPQLFDGETVGE